MPENYIEVFRDLWQYQEFRVLYHSLRYSLLVIAMLLIVFFLLHIIYMLGYNSPLYRGKSPRIGWSKRLIPSILILFSILLGLFWVGGYMIAQVGPI
ncbi:TPA: hypothetical protein DCF80_01350 [Candidatus Saccharibacteria bacterium]|nr:hypothetical protein [Candidatus Saccharibacteria bacterium]HRK40970.1 hypothetical protein [Candidatus Saccharibacteria bacterium]